MPKALLPIVLILMMPTTTHSQTLRVPAEWEPHAATWMQWPGPWEAQMRPEMAEIVRVIQAYEPLHILTSTAGEQQAAERFLSDRDVPLDNVRWHLVPIDNSWMRDNGPIYVTDGESTWIQNWRFDAWGGNFGDDIPFADDDRVPLRVAEILGTTAADHRDYVLERGNVEVDGAGTLVLNWDCQNDRNPGMSQAEHEAILKAALGVHRILWAYGYHPEDGTIGHIDGTARFVDRDTIAIADYGTALERDLAAACEAAGLEVVWYPGDPNWLLGNGFVAGIASGDPTRDDELRALLGSLFPGRDIHLLDIPRIAESGGGIHCVTNDQPAEPGGVFGDGFETADTGRWSAAVGDLDA